MVASWYLTEEVVCSNILLCTFFVTEFSDLVNSMKTFVENSIMSSLLLFK